MVLWSSSTTRPTISRTIVKEETKGTGLQFNCYNALVILNPVIPQAKEKRLAVYRKAGPKDAVVRVSQSIPCWRMHQPYSQVQHRQESKDASFKPMKRKGMKRNEKKKRKEAKDQPD